MLQFLSCSVSGWKSSQNKFHSAIRSQLMAHMCHFDIHQLSAPVQLVIAPRCSHSTPPIRTLLRSSCSSECVCLSTLLIISSRVHKADVMARYLQVLMEIEESPASFERRLENAGQSVEAQDSELLMLLCAMPP